MVAICREETPRAHSAFNRRDGASTAIRVKHALEHRHFDRTVIGPAVPADRSSSGDRRSRPSASALQEPSVDINDE